MIIDFHAHVFDDDMRTRRSEYLGRDAWFASLYSDPKRRLASAEDVIASMQASGVDRTVIMGFPWRDGGVCREHNDYIIDAVSRFPDKLIGFACVQPLDAGDAKELDRCLTAGLRGLGELGPDGQRFSVTEKWVLEASVDVLLKQDAPLLIHSSEPLGHDYAGKGETHPWKLVKMAQNFPDLKIVMAHWGGGLPFYELMPEVRAALRNVYYDSAASSFLYDTSIFRAVVGLVGAQRVLWGTDYPLLSQSKFLARVRACGLGHDDEEAILGGNAATLLRL